MTMTMKEGARQSLLNGSKNKPEPMGIFVTSIDPATTTILCAAGFDFIILDCEHGPMDRATALNHIRAARGFPTLMFVRSLSSTSEAIQSYLDIGAQAIILPKMETAAAMQQAVAAGRYQSGGRGLCPGCEGALFSSENWLEFAREANEGNMIIPLIETKAGLDNLAEIAAVDGVDVLMFGPADLGQDVGIDLFSQKEELHELWRQFAAAVHGAGKLTMVPYGWGFDGADILVNSMDLRVLRITADQMVAKHKSG